MILRNTETVKQHIAINKTFSWDTLSPYALQAEIKFVKPILGSALFSSLEQAIDSNTYTNEQKELLAFIYPMVANFTMFLLGPQLLTSVSELGFQQNSSKEGTSTPVSMEKYNETRLSYWKTADDYREFTYNFLQQNQTLFPDWVSSSAYSIYSQLFIRNNAELNDYLGMGGSVSTYLTLKPHIKLCEDKYVTPITSEAFAEYLKTTNKQNGLSVMEATLMDKIKNALAWLTIYEAAPTLTAIIEDGVLITAVPGIRSKAFQPLTEEQTNQIRVDALNKGTMYLSRLKEFLDSNAAEFPLYLNSNCYKQRQQDYSLPDNSLNTSFGFY